MKIKIDSLENIDLAAAKFTELTAGKNIFAFYGSMGAGKTTFIKSVCENLGIKDVINSPTFAIINEYSLPNGKPIFHFDFYRLKTAEEAFDLGYEEYFYSGNKCFIEWPEKIESLLPDDCIKVYITVEEDGKRVISF